MLEPYLPASARRFAGSFGWYASILLFVLIIGVPTAGNALFGGSFAVFVALGGDREAAIAGFQELLFWR